MVPRDGIARLVKLCLTGEVSPPPAAETADILRPDISAKLQKEMVPRDGIEPPTQGFSVPRSTD